MSITYKQLMAAEAAVGWALSEMEVEDALASVSDTTTDVLEKQLASLVAQFEARAGRGPELASSIDSLRIAIAARKAVEVDG